MALVEIVSNDGVCQLCFYEIEEDGSCHDGCFAAEINEVLSNAN